MNGKITIISAAFFIICGVIGAVSLGAVRDRDRRVDEYRDQYEQASGRVEELTAGIGRIESTVGGVAEELERDATNLREVIERLRVIKEAVHDIEVELYRLRGFDGGSDSRDGG
jgi:DNA repair ATPase RecN